MLPDPPPPISVCMAGVGPGRAEPVPSRAVLPLTEAATDTAPSSSTPRWSRLERPMHPLYMHIVPIAPDIDPSLAIREGDIRRFFSPGTLTAGRSYEQRGRVQDLEIGARGHHRDDPGQQPRSLRPKPEGQPLPQQRHPHRRRLFLPARPRLQAPCRRADRRPAQRTAGPSPPGIPVPTDIQNPSRDRASGADPKLACRFRPR
jgi:hypothetical protein